MRLEGERESDNVEDRRGAGPQQQMMAGGGILTLIIVLIGLFLGVDQRTLMRLMQQGQQQGGAIQIGPAGAPQAAPIHDECSVFVKKILAETEDVWTELFGEMGRKYQEPKLVMFTQQVRSGCGLANAGVGPFYCPADRVVYIDPTFYDELERKYKAPGQFAQAYVIAHEIGHHVQNLLGTSDKVQAARERSSEKQANDLSVRLELQADFLAGVWAHHIQRGKAVLEQGDIEAGITAAQAIGDDRLQKQAQGYVRPDSFTHGSSAQRTRWFLKGYKSGRIQDGDTFSAASASDL